MFVTGVSAFNHMVFEAAIVLGLPEAETSVIVSWQRHTKKLLWALEFVVSPFVTVICMSRTLARLFAVLSARFP